MAVYTIGTRLHDMGRGTPAEMFSKTRDAGFGCVQLAYKKSIEGVNSYAGITPALIEQTKTAMADTGVGVAVLGTYVELGHAEESERGRAVADFTSQIAVCKALNAGCIGSETTNMSAQPAGTTRKEAQACLLKSLAAILPAAEEAGVLVGIEPVYYHAMNTPEAAKMVLDSIASPNLRIIFDAANLLGPEDEHRQAALWDRAMNLWGDKIVACHLKGLAFDEKGDFHSTPLENSCLDYPLLASFIRQQPQDLPLLREEGTPAGAATDVKLLKNWFCT